MVVGSPQPCLAIKGPLVRVGNVLPPALRPGHPEPLTGDTTALQPGDLPGPGSRESACPGPSPHSATALSSERHLSGNGESLNISLQVTK